MMHTVTSDIDLPETVAPHKRLPHPRLLLGVPLHFIPNNSFAVEKRGPIHGDVRRRHVGDLQDDGGVVLICLGDSRQWLVDVGVEFVVGIFPAVDIASVRVSRGFDEKRGAWNRFVKGRAIADRHDLLGDMVVI